MKEDAAGWLHVNPAAAHVLLSSSQLSELMCGCAFLWTTSGMLWLRSGFRALCHFGMLHDAGPEQATGDHHCWLPSSATQALTICRLPGRQHAAASPGQALK